MATSSFKYVSEDGSVASDDVIRQPTGKPTQPRQKKAIKSAPAFGAPVGAHARDVVNPARDLIVIFMTQLMPSSTYPIRRELRTLVYSALEDVARR